jgi:hypothetical protein
MAGYLGADFNANQPSNDDLVKKGAAIFRDIKTRLKTFFAVLFDLETGQLKDNIITSAKLKDLNPDPTGTWKTVTVNEKGLVTAGTNPDESSASFPRRIVYYFTGAIQDDGTNIAASAAFDDNGLAVAEYSFTVPAGVTRLMVQLQGAGGGGGSINTSGAGGGGGGSAAEAIIEVIPSDVYLIWVGQGGTGQVQGGAAAVAGAMSKFEFDATHNIECEGGGAGTEVAVGAGGIATATTWAVMKKNGTDGTTTSGGLAGGYFHFGDGGGGTPENGGTAPGLDGGDGRLILTYWSI